MTSRRVAALCLAAACVLLAFALFMAFDNTAVDVGASDLGDKGPAGDVGCVVAPWDAVLNSNSEGPGGEHSQPYFEEVASDCYAANKTRFTTAIASGVIAFLLLAVGGVLTVRSPRPVHATSD